MRKLSDLHNYQLHGVDFIKFNLACALFLDMGLGKTVSSLTAVDFLLNEDLSIRKPLIVAPKRVAEHTWGAEVNEWEHLKHLRVSVIAGTAAQRLAALEVKADIYTIGRDNIAWLVAHYRGAWPFDCVILDELSSFKNHRSQRFKAIRAIRSKVKRIIGLTGTPTPNGLMDLWAQMFLLDQGDRLGETIGAYRDQYFTPGRRKGHVGYEYKLKSDKASEVNIYEKEILAKISDICISMKAEDYLELPGRNDIDKWVYLSEANMRKYNEFERDLIMSIGDEEITANNAAGLSVKLRQFANGAIYDEDGNWHTVHDEKLEALEEEIEAANGKPVLIFYQFKHDLERIMQRLKAYKPVLLKGSNEIDAWNRGEIQVLICHAASAGHGLNLQYGGNIMFWFGLDFNLELYQQAHDRLDRQGQTSIVLNNRILTKGTIDEDVAQALSDKATLQDAVMEAIKARIKKWKN